MIHRYPVGTMIHTRHIALPGEDPIAVVLGPTASGRYLRAAVIGVGRPLEKRRYRWECFLYPDDIVGVLTSGPMQRVTHGG